MKNIMTLLLLGTLTACASKPNSSILNDECGVSALLSGVSCVDPDYNAIAAAPLGSQQNPVKSDGPSGQREYLSRLICSNGVSVSGFHRLGSAGSNPYGFMSDVYEVRCETEAGVVEHQIYLDMYHRGYIEVQPVDGFSIINE